MLTGYLKWNLHGKSLVTEKVTFYFSLETVTRSSFLFYTTHVPEFGCAWVSSSGMNPSGLQFRSSVIRYCFVSPGFPFEKVRAGGSVGTADLCKLPNCGSC